MPSLPATDRISELSTAERAQILDVLFEPCTQLHTLSVEKLQEEHFVNYNALIDYIGLQLSSLLVSKLESDRKWLDTILAAHPRLGEKKVESEQSQQEQAQLNQGGLAEAEKLAALNKAYEDAFPDLRYV